MKWMRKHAAFKSIGGIVLLLVVFFVIVCLIGFNTFTDALLSQYTDGAFLTAGVATRVVDANRMEEYARSGGTTAEYQEVLKQLDALCNASGSTFIYVIRPDRTDYGHITFLFSTINHNNHYTVFDFGHVRQTTNDEYRSKYRALYERRSARELVIRDKGYIETDAHITAMVSLVSSDGTVQGILCVQRQMDTLTKARQSYLNKILMTLVFLILFVIIGQGLFLHHMLLHPVRLISDEARRFAKENRLPGRKLQDMIRNRDEIGTLAESVDHMEQQIQEYIAYLTRSTAEKERIKTELSLAAQIQSAMLPHDFPPFPDREEFDLYASMDPAREVGGDFYDYFFVDEDHLCLEIADVSGKGIPGALFMMVSKALLKSCAVGGASAAEILSQINETICSSNRAEMFVTVWLGILEISTGKLTAANAGHEYPVIRRAGGDFELLKDKHGLVIGGMPGIKYRNYELQLNPGDKLFVYTDGVPEATNADNELFGTDRMVDALNGVKDGSPEQVLEGVRRAVDGFVRDAEQFDDMTMLCLEYKGEKTPMKTITTEATVDSIRVITEFVDGELEAINCPLRAQMHFRVAIDELVSNIARCAYEEGTGTITVTFAYDEQERTVSLTFEDRGIPYDPVQKEDPDISRPADEREVGGLGIFLVRKIMDDMAYRREDGRNILRIRKKI